MKKLKTPEQARAELRRRGVTVTAFARKHRISRAIVFEVLGGRKKGHYGESHRAAVLLGIKDGILDNSDAAKKICPEGATSRAIDS
jgi:gp16 family phage-associated protein